MSRRIFKRKCIVLNTKFIQAMLCNTITLNHSVISKIIQVMLWFFFFLQLKFLSSKINYLNFSFSKEDYHDNQTLSQI